MESLGLGPTRGIVERSGQVKKYAWWISLPMRLQVSWMPARNEPQPLVEDLADVDVAQLAVEPAEQRSASVAEAVPPSAIAWSDSQAAGDAEPDGAGEVGVEHQVADDALRVDPVVVLAQVGLVGRAAAQEARPVDDPHGRLDDRPARRGGRAA